MSSINKPEYINYATVDKVIDGDTYDCTVHLPFGIFCKQRFRLHGADTPETWRPKTESEARHGKKATDYVVSAIEGKEVILKTYKDIGVYGRYTAEVWILSVNRTPVNSLADLLKDAGLLKLDSYTD
jgi:endonuclease YncB( thermonuclease family)